MAQQVVIAGAMFNDVPSISVPDSNNVYHPFTDVSDTTAAAADVTSGKYFYTAAGVKTAGTASGGTPTLITKSITQNGTYNASSDNADGYSSVSVNVSGGGGLVYETGTWTPSENVSTYTITFTNTHTSAPFYYLIVDATGDYSNVTNSNYFLEYVNNHQLTGAPYYESSTVIHYGEVRTTNRAGNATSFTNGTTTITAPYTSTSSSATAHSRYWATETGIKAYTNSTSRYWRAGRTYKWIAVWAPTS